MKITIEIELGNAAMRTGSDLAWALCELAEQQHGLALHVGDTHVIRDINGNKVGLAEIKES